MSDPVGTGCTTDNHHNPASQDNMSQSTREHRAVVPTYAILHVRDAVGTGCTTDNHHNQASQDTRPQSATEYIAVVSCTRH